MLDLARGVLGRTHLCAVRACSPHLTVFVLEWGSATRSSLCDEGAHHYDELFEIYFSIAIHVDFPDHLLDLLLC